MSHYCPRCAQPLPKRWRSDMQDGVFRCECGARLCTLASSGWEVPVIALGSGVSSVLISLGPDGTLTRAVLGGLAAAALVLLTHVLYRRPRRVSAGIDDAVRSGSR